MPNSDERTRFLWVPVAFSNVDEVVEVHNIERRGQAAIGVNGAICLCQSGQVFNVDVRRVKKWQD